MLFRIGLRDVRRVMARAFGQFAAEPRRPELERARWLAHEPIAARRKLYAAVFFLALALTAAFFFAGACPETGFFGVTAVPAGAFVAPAFASVVFFAGVFLAGAFFAVTAFTGAFATVASLVTAFLAGAFAGGALLDPFQVKRAFFARATTLAMSSSEYTPLTPDMAASFMPCLMPSL